MIKDWYTDWFNTDEYLEVYKHRNEQEADRHIKFILSQVKLNPGASILDFACGAGRHSLLLAKKGFHVTGVDLSERLLHEAKKNARAENLKLNFIKSDLRDFNTDEKFDLVLNLFTSFGYFENDEENFCVFEKAHKFLKSNGYFVFDYFNKNYIEKNLIEYSEEKTGSFFIVQKRKINNNRVEKEIIIRENGRFKTFVESVKLYDSDFLVGKLTEYGFEIKGLFGDFSANNFNKNDSPRFIAICRK